MKTAQLHEATARLSELIEEATEGEAILVTWYGKPVAKLTGRKPPGRRELGFRPIALESDLLAPTDAGVLETFQRDG